MERFAQNPIIEVFAQAIRRDRRFALTTNILESEILSWDEILVKYKFIYLVIFNLTSEHLNILQFLDSPCQNIIYWFD